MQNLMNYSKLLQRYKKAEIFFDKASIEEQVKHYDSFTKLLNEIVKQEKKLIDSGMVEKVNKLRQKTFLEIEKEI